MKKGYKPEKAILRQWAEKLLKKNASGSGLQLSESDALKLIHELQVHQIELELQNEELILAQEHAEDVSTKYAELYDSAPTGYFTLSQKGEILELNPAGAKMLGNDRENLKDRPFQLYVSNASKPIFNLFLEKIFAGNIKQTCELTLSTNTDGQIYIELSGIVSKNGDKCSLTANDITERKQAEEILRESETKTRTILEAISTGIMIIDPETHTIVDVNSEAIRLIGETKEKIVGSICHQYICPAEVGKCPVTDLRQIIDNSERVLINKEHTKIPILKTATQINLGGRKLLLENFTDITERKLTEEELHKSEQRYRNLFENAGTAIWEADLSVVINYINQLKKSGILDFRMYFNQHIDEVIKCASMVKLLDANKEILNLVKGKSKEEVLSRLFDFFIEESFDAVKEEFIGLAEGKLRIDGEMPLKILNGEIRQVIFQLSIIHGEEKGLISFIDITDKKKNEQALRESEKRLLQIMENVDAVFYMISGKTGELVFINSAYEKIWKRPIDEIKEHPETWLDAVHPEDVNSAIKLFEQEIGELQYRIILPDGTIRWILDRMFPVLDEKGEIVYLCGMAADITDRKLYEETLRESGAKLDEAMKIAKLGMWEYDVDKDQFIFNDQFYTLLRTTAEREGGYIMSSKHYAQKFVHPDDMFLVGSETQKALETNDPNYHNKLDHRIILADGEIGYISVSVRILKDSHGRTVKTYGVNQDITESKRINESLVLFRTLIDKSNDVIEVIDTETARFIDVNEKACTELGYSRSELLSMKVFDVDPNLTTEIFHKLIQQSQQSDSAIFEAFHQRKDGSIFPVEVNVTGVKLEKMYALAIVRDLTERKQSTAAMEMAKKYTENLIETANTIVIGLDASGNIAIFNKAAEDITGYTRSELKGRNWFETLVPKQRYPKVWKKFKKLSNSEIPKKFENPILTKSGEERYIVWQNNQITEQGNVVGTISFGIDITERRKSEEALLESQQILEGIINTIPVRVFWKDRNLVYLGCNKIFAHDAGYTDPSKIIGKDDFQMGWKDQAEMYRSDDLFVIENGKSKLLIEESQTTPEGKTITLLTSKIPLRGFNNEIIGILGTYIDITERKQSEEEIIILAHSLKSVSECVSITDLDDKILFVNESFMRIYGYKKEELIGKKISIVRSPNNPPELISEILPATKLGGWTGELLNRRKDGSEFPIHLSTTMINDKAEKPLGLIGVATDITERRLFEQELIGAKERAEGSDRLKSSFLANMSHEVRTPLNSIIGFSELLADPDFDEDQKDEFINHIITSGNNLLNIISDIMDISKLESGEIKIRNRKINVHDYISKVENQYAFHAKEKNLGLTISHPIDSEETAIFADPDRLTQIFNNLMSNAIKFTEIGKIEICYQPKGKMVEFCIKDTGIGIPEKYQEKIFERFRQVDDETNRKFGGNGLGLAISKNLIELMGGKIWLVSEPGIGSEFYFTLPDHLLKE
ncbi:MAG: PAS domain S-box protein [Prolixibacteraceae bacterium]|jgi:PAS domain S-box-containing protein